MGMGAGNAGTQGGAGTGTAGAGTGDAGGAAGGNAAGGMGAGGQGSSQGGAGSGAQGSGAGASGGSGSGGNADGSGAGDWTVGLDDSTRGFVQNKGWKGPADVLTSYQNLEKLVGAQEHLVKLPTKADDVEGWNAVYAKLGRPEKPEGYKIEVPKENGNPEFAEWAKGTFHSLGLSAKQGETLVAKWNEMQAAAVQKQQQDFQASTETDNTKLKQEWGAAYDDKNKFADAAVKQFGMTQEQMNALRQSMGFANAMKFLSNIGEKVGEHGFVTGGQGNKSGAYTPEAAREKIKSLTADPEWRAKYIGGSAEHRAEMQRLQQMANPELEA